MQPPTPQDEDERLDALRRYHVLDTAAEEQFDRLAHLAAFVCHAPIALVSLVDKDRQWFKSRVGLETTETPRAEAFCAHAILGPDLLVVPDALVDLRFSSNPLVTGPLRVRFYAGAPLVTPEGHAVGTLSVLDTDPRRLDEGRAGALRSLAAQAVVLLEMRRQSADLARLAEALSIEVKERRRSESLRAYEATHDALTGLANRALFLEHLRRQVAHAERHPNYRFALLFADLDDFKVVNDRLGHALHIPAGGDRVRAASATRAVGLVTRVGRGVLIEVPRPSLSPPPACQSVQTKTPAAGYSVRRRAGGLTRPNFRAFAPLMSGFYGVIQPAGLSVLGSSRLSSHSPPMLATSAGW